MRVAIQGITGSYSDEAARTLFGDDVAILECDDFESAFSAVQQREAQHAVIPIENKIVGEITTPAELLRLGKYRVCDKLPLKVQHVLAGTSEAELSNLRSIRSHVEALRQCRRFLRSNDHLTQIVAADTASAVRQIVADADPAHAAICSRRAADIYGAKILVESIADDPDNWTTFYVIGN